MPAETDRQTGRHRAAGRVDVERNVLVGVLGFEEQQLRDDQVGDFVVDPSAEEDHAVLEKARVDVIRAFAATAFFDDHGNEAAHVDWYP
jgi:hypothetical protein